MDDLRWCHAAGTDIGRVRDHNEDSFLAVPESGVFAVADGLGGHAAGEVASELATLTIAEELCLVTGESSQEDVRVILEAGIQLANEAILDKADHDPALTGMGTTLTVLVLSANGTYSIGHVGDSRAYLFQGGILRRLTRDHTVVQELVERGRLTDEQARVHPRASVLTRALGIEPDVTPDIYGGSVRTGDRFLLTTDGLTSMVKEARLQPLLTAYPEPQEAVRALIDTGNRAGGADNLTVIVVNLGPSD